MAYNVLFNEMDAVRQVYSVLRGWYSVHQPDEACNLKRQKLTITVPTDEGQSALEEIVEKLHMTKKRKKFQATPKLE